MKSFSIIALFLICKTITQATQTRSFSQLYKNPLQSKKKFSFLPAVKSSNWKHTENCFEQFCNRENYFNEVSQKLNNKMSQSKNCEEFIKERQQGNLQLPFPTEKLKNCINSLSDLDINEQYMTQCLCQCGDTNCYNGGKISVASFIACEITQCTYQQTISQQQFQDFQMCTYTNSKCKYNIEISQKINDENNQDLSVLYTELKLKETGECNSVCAKEAGIPQDEIQCIYDCMDNNYNFSLALQFYLFSFSLFALILI
ncbi:hypothetical protein PPERSA_00680 [Pseudocohnilembus persalinus]|uniref:Transmembrane protein n=1 Tax=Pseudocohnilembus persalinus TaxID=266149 RepID=A0A0V0QSR0_PSEPJ|nr:hypothetical protein PPERSA_00680 [Pseudocohnilembus persalinus]|eukprot:KRX05379.1 hypothetical protein PPERSA_00680 [Pseudocohnilembus persalinus]